VNAPLPIHWFKSSIALFYHFVNPFFREAAVRLLGND